MLAYVDAQTGARLQRPPREDRLGLALPNNRRDGLVVDHVLRRPVRRLPDEHTARWGRRLQPRARVHDVAGRHPLTRLRVRVESDEGFAARDADSYL
jgi:hypothetical protein